MIEIIVLWCYAFGLTLVMVAVFSPHPRAHDVGLLGVASLLLALILVIFRT